METFSKAKDYIFMVLLGIIGFFLSGVLDDVKEIRGDTEALLVDMREVQTRVSRLELTTFGNLAQANTDTANHPNNKFRPAPEVDYSGGYARPDTPAHSHVMPISNPHGSSGGLVRLCSDTRPKGAPAPAQSSQADLPTGIDNLWVLILVGVGVVAMMLLKLYYDSAPRDGPGLQSFLSSLFQNAKRN